MLSGDRNGRGGSTAFAYAVYDCLGAAAAVLAAPLLLFIGLRQRRQGFGERLGILPDTVTQLQQPLWIHAASVGEVLAAQPLIRELRRLRPGVPLLVSTTSLPGRATAQQRLGADAVMLLPADFRWIVDAAMRRIRPRGLVIVETELWPSLLRAAAQNAVNTVLVSGRISPRSAGRYAKIRWLTRAMLQHVAACLMQSPADAERIIALGAVADRVEVIGSLKFARDAGTVTARPQVNALTTVATQRPILVAASTHPGEEEIVLEACRVVWQKHPHALLLLAPRRPERFYDVAGLLQQRGLRMLRRSAITAELPPDLQVLLLDTVGELLDFLPVARAVFVGGTVVAGVGGHNILEPAVFAKPVSFGPHTANVAEPAAALLATGAATLVHSSAELAAEWTRLLDDPEAAVAMGRHGREVVAAQANVAQRTAERVCQILTPRSNASPHGA
jgi:3-deoxy-D-manno-octulosonic-acid transferase